MSYLHLIDRFFGNPLNIEQSKLDVLTSEVFVKLLLNEPINRTERTPVAAIDSSVEVPSNVKVIPVHGSLVNKNGAGSSGVTSYESIGKQTMQALAEGYTVIGYDFSSGGGEAHGNFALGRLIASLPEKFGVQTFAYTDSMSASASYALMAATQRVFAADTSTTGSIGTLMTLYDLTKADEKSGVKYTILRSKEHKALYNPHEVVSEEIIKESLASLKIWDNKFNEYVTSVRPALELKTVLSLDGRTAMGDEALQIGLIDEIAPTLQDVVDRYDKSKANVTSSTSAKASNVYVNKTEVTHMAKTVEELMSEVLELKSENETLKQSAALQKSEATILERNRITTILQSAETFGIKDNNAVLGSIKSGMDLNSVNLLFTSIKSAVDAANVIATSSENAVPSGADKVTVQELQELANKQKAGETSFANGKFGMNDLLSAMGEIGTVGGE